MVFEAAKSLFVPGALLPGRPGERERGSGRGGQVYPLKLFRSGAPGSGSKRAQWPAGLFWELIESGHLLPFSGLGTNQSITDFFIFFFSLRAKRGNEQ
jgi:hypothetical protein